MGNTCSVPVDYYKTDYDYAVHRCDIRREEKFKLFLAIRDDPEENVVEYMKEHPWALHCMFWFEIQKNKNTGKLCTCALNLEQGITDCIAKEDILKTLEICIRYAMCPHLLLQQKGISVPNTQSISRNELMILNDITQAKGGIRNSLKATAGLYWIHLAIFWNKERLIRDTLQFCIKEKLNFPSYTVYHHISAVLLAIIHGNATAVKELAIFEPSSILQPPRNFNNNNNNTFQDNTTEYRHGSLSLALATNQFENFKTLYGCLSKVDLKRLSTLQDHSPNIALWNMFTLMMEDLIVNRNPSTVYDLLSIKRIPIYAYASLFSLIYKLDIYWAYKTVFEQTDFCRQFICWKRKRDKNRMKFLDSLMCTVVFHGNADIVRVFLKYGFNSNAKLNRCSILVWAEGLQYREIADQLISTGAVRKRHPKMTSLVDVAIASYRCYFTCLTDPAFSLLSLIHSLYENGHEITDFSSLTNVWDYDIVDYIMLREHDPRLLEKYFLRCHNKMYQHFLYCIISSNCSIRFSSMMVLNVIDFLRKTHSPYITFYIMSEISNYPLSNGRIQIEEKDTSHVDLNNICPQRLKSLCRNRLRLHFKGYKFFKFLNLMKTTIPLSIQSFLQKEDVLELFLSEVNRKHLDEQSYRARKYFV